MGNFRKDGRRVEILLVEDNPGDVFLLSKFLRGSKVPNRLRVARDGEEAVRLLRREGEFSGAGRPDLVLLDLGLPRMDGQETLREIKGDPELRDLPVVILTTSDRQSDVLGSYESRANFYLRKPRELTEFAAVIGYLERYWMRIRPNGNGFPAPRGGTGVSVAEKG